MASCVHCGTSPERDETFSHCSRCKVMVYCSKTCQKQHWKSGQTQGHLPGLEREQRHGEADREQDNEGRREGTIEGIG